MTTLRFELWGRRIAFGFLAGVGPRFWIEDHDYDLATVPVVEYVSGARVCHNPKTYWKSVEARAEAREQERDQHWKDTHQPETTGAEA